MLQPHHIQKKSAGKHPFPSTPESIFFCCIPNICPFYLHSSFVGSTKTDRWIAVEFTRVSVWSKENWRKQKWVSYGAIHCKTTRHQWEICLQLFLKLFQPSTVSYNILLATSLKNVNKGDVKGMGVYKHCLGNGDGFLRSVCQKKTQGKIVLSVITCAASCHRDD